MSSKKNADTKALRSENRGLRKEVEELSSYVKNLEEQVKSAYSTNSQKESAMMSSDGAKTVEFVSSQCDEMVALHRKTLKELQKITERLESISKRCKEIEEFVDHAEDYSFQYNVKIFGMPMISTNEKAEVTIELCLNLFSSIGAQTVNIADIDIAHRVPSRNPSPNKPDAIVCRFTRRLARNRVLDCSKAVCEVTAEQLGFNHDISVDDLRICEHLSPRQQSLFSEAKKLKNAHQFKFCWVKGGTIQLRESEDSRIFKLRNSDDLFRLERKLTHPQDVEPES